MFFDKPSLEIARNLLREQCPHVTADDVRFVTAGWDNALFRVDDSSVLRLPRRIEAVETVHNEQTIFALLPQLLSGKPSLVATPQLLYGGQPTPYFRHPWSLLRWLPGVSLFENPFEDVSTQAETLASFLTALHQPAPASAPSNPYRGGPLETRTGLLIQNLAAFGNKLRDRNFTEADIETMWNRLLPTEPWSGPSVWLHGDIHPGNILTKDGQLSAVIDWGDVCSGDPATDLAAAWTLFDKPDRLLFRQSLERAGHPCGDATWRRAQAWALSLGLSHLSGSDETTHINFGLIVIERTLD